MYSSSLEIAQTQDFGLTVNGSPDQGFQSLDFKAFPDQYRRTDYFDCMRRYNYAEILPSQSEASFSDYEHQTPSPPHNYEEDLYNSHHQAKSPIGQSILSGSFDYLSAEQPQFQIPIDCDYTTNTETSLNGYNYGHYNNQNNHGNHGNHGNHVSQIYSDRQPTWALSSDVNYLSRMTDNLCDNFPLAYQSLINNIGGNTSTSNSSVNGGSFDTNYHPLSGCGGAAIDSATLRVASPICTVPSQLSEIVFRERSSSTFSSSSSTNSMSDQSSTSATKTKPNSKLIKTSRAQLAKQASNNNGTKQTRSRGRRVSNSPSPSGQKMFTCTKDECGKVFKRSEHLKRHIRSIHTLEKPFECPYQTCSKKFSRSDNLNQHIRIHRHTGKDKPNPPITCRQGSFGGYGYL